MGALLRPLANVVAVVLALALLGVLLLISSGANDGAQRALDQHMRTLREIGAALQQEVVTADGLEIDISQRFSALHEEFSAAQLGISLRVNELFPKRQSLLTPSRDFAFNRFNAIDSSGRERASEAEFRARVTQLNNAAETLKSSISRFASAQGQYLAQREAVHERGRQAVGALRQSGFDSAADTAFASVQQALERIGHLRGTDTNAVNGTLQRIRDINLPDAALLTNVNALAEDVAALIPLRQTLDEQLKKVTASKFVILAEDVREFVTSDYLFTLKSVGDARVLLNLYTLLMLLNLVYFGIRLQWSHRALNQSHTILEERVKERTFELETAYEELKESEVQLVQAEKMSSLGQLVAGVVHEINTPLLYVLNNTAMTSETLAEIDRSLNVVKELTRCLQEPDLPKEQVKQLLEDLRESMDLAALEENIEEVVALTRDSTEGLNDIDQLVKSLKDFSRLDRATYDDFDLRDGLEKTLIITRNLLKYGIELEQDLQEVPTVRCAPSRVNQVFINLITNAAQAMDGEGTLKISTYLGQEGYVNVDVADTGCGISAENLQKVMDPFFTTKPVGQGTGLGLSIVRTIMDEHQGEFLIESKEGEGTRITLSFPILGAEQGDTPSVEEEEAA